MLFSNIQFKSHLFELSSSRQERLLYLILIIYLCKTLVLLPPLLTNWSLCVCVCVCEYGTRKREGGQLFQLTRADRKLSLSQVRGRSSTDIVLSHSETQCVGGGGLSVSTFAWSLFLPPPPPPLSLSCSRSLCLSSPFLEINQDGMFGK